MRRFPPRSAASSIQIVGWPLLGLVAAARLGDPRRSWLLDFVDTWLLYLLAPWPLLALLAARTRSLSLGLLAGIGSAFALAHGRAVLGHGGQPAAPCGPRLRVLTANVLGDNPSAAGLAALIERERPDVVALQEVRSAFGADLVERVHHQLPYQAIEPHERHAGAALLSRWPLAGLQTFRLAEHNHLCQRVCLIVDGREVDFFNIHLETPFELYGRPGRLPPFGIRRRARSARDRELDRLIALIEPLDGPVLVVGDFNSAAGSRPHRQLLGHLRDAFREVGRGLGHTFPQATPIHGLVVPLPILRIDYAFFKGPLVPLAARTLTQPGSDHRAVLAEFALPEAHHAGT